jgi:hypothetical protein
MVAFGWYLGGGLGEPWPDCDHIKFVRYKIKISYATMFVLDLCILFI